MSPTDYYKEVEDFYEREESKRFYSLLVLYEKEINSCFGVAAQLQSLKNLLTSGNTASPTLISNYAVGNFLDLRSLLNHIVLLSENDLLKNNDERFIKVRNWIHRDMTFNEISLARQRLDQYMEEINKEKNLQKIKEDRVHVALNEFNSLFDIYHKEIYRCKGVLREMQTSRSSLSKGNELSPQVYCSYSEENLKKLRQFIKKVDNCLNSDPSLASSNAIVSFTQWVFDEMTLSDVSESEKKLHRSIALANEQMKTARIFKKIGIE